jgi:hypothetical protein
MAVVFGTDTIACLHQSTQTLITWGRHDMLINRAIKSLFIKLIRDTPHQRHVLGLAGIHTAINGIRMGFHLGGRHAQRVRQRGNEHRIGRYRL